MPSPRGASLTALCRPSSSIAHTSCRLYARSGAGTEAPCAPRVRAIANYLLTATEEFENLPAGATVHGPPIERLIERARHRKAELEEQLGYAPDQWHLVTSELLQGVYIRTVNTYAEPKFGLDLQAGEVFALVRKVALTASLIVPRATLLPLGHYEGVEDRSDQICVHTAVAGQADFLLTAKKSLINRAFSDPATQTRVRAVDWETLVDQINTSSFDLATVAPGIW